MVCPLKLIKGSLKDQSGREIDPYYTAHLQCESDCGWLVEHIYETPTCAIKALAFTLNEIFDALMEEAKEDQDVVDN